MLTFEDAEELFDVDDAEAAVDEDEVVEEAELWLSWLILFLSRSNSEIFLSNEAETAEAESPDNKELKEQPKAKAASNGSEEEPGVEGGEEKSRREDMGEDEDVVLLPLLLWLFWKLPANLLLLSSESRLRSKMRGGLFVKLSWSVTFPNMFVLFFPEVYIIRAGRNNYARIFFKGGLSCWICW